jgi:hypothetical protein
VPKLPGRHASSHRSLQTVLARTHGRSTASRLVTAYSVPRTAYRYVLSARGRLGLSVATGGQEAKETGASSCSLRLARRAPPASYETSRIVKSVLTRQVGLFQGSVS